MKLKKYWFHNFSFLLEKNTSKVNKYVLKYYNWKLKILAISFQDTIQVGKSLQYSNNDGKEAQKSM